MLFFTFYCARITARREYAVQNRILVVEDDYSISELICMNLTVAGYEAVPVYEGDGVEKLSLIHI